MSEPPEYTHITPHGVKVRIVDTTRYGWYVMSNGAIIDDEILDKWQKVSEK